MITREVIELFKNSNSFLLHMIDAQPQYYMAHVAETISTKEVIVLGVAAMIAHNPVISRRFWGK